MSFSIENKAGQGFDKLILKDKESLTAIEIIPSCGAILHAFTIMHNNKRLNVIDNYKSETDFKEHVTSKGFKSCKLSPFACRIKNAQYKFGKKKYTIKKFSLGKNALHGLLYDAPFSITEQHANTNEASVTLQHSYRSTEQGYPFNYDCIVTYQLKKENKLFIKTEIINKGKRQMPIQDGWHPYFKLGKKIDTLQLAFRAKERIITDNELIPTGRSLFYNDFNALKKIGSTCLDTCFVLDLEEHSPLCVLRNTEEKIQLEIQPGKTYPYLQIYTPAHRKSIAIENLSAAPDAFNNAMGLITLAPHEGTNFETSYKITLLA